jgi:hypothetical protein
MTGDTVALHRTADPLIGVDRHSALFDDDLVAGDRPCDLAGDSFHVGEICIPSFALGGADGDKDGRALMGGFAKVGHETDLVVAISLQQFGKVVLMDEGVASLKRGDLAFIIIDTDDIVAHLCETYCRDQADVA